MGLNYGVFLWLGWGWVKFSPLLEDLQGRGYTVEIDRTAYVGGYGYVSPTPFLYALELGVFTGAKGEGRGYALSVGQATVKGTVGYRYFRWRVRERNMDLYPFLGVGYGRVWVSFSSTGDLSYGDFTADPGRGGTMYKNDYLATFGLGALLDFGFTVAITLGYDLSVAREVWVYGDDHLDGGPDVSPYGLNARFMVGYAGDWGE